MSATHGPGRMQSLARLVALLLCIAIALPTLPFQPLPASGAATTSGDTRAVGRNGTTTGPVAARVRGGHTGTRPAQRDPLTASPARHVPGGRRGATQGAIRPPRRPDPLTHTGRIAPSSGAAAHAGSSALTLATSAGSPGAVGFGTPTEPPTGTGMGVQPPTRRPARPLNAAPTIVTVDTTSILVDGNTSSVSALLSNKGADGKISLTEALAAANNSGGAAITINFSSTLGHGATIRLDDTIALTVPDTTIDGHFGGDGSTAAPPDVLILGDPGIITLSIESDHDVLRNLAMQLPVLSGAGAHDDKILNCYLGTDVNGINSLHLVSNGVELRLGAHDNTIEDDVIAGNDDQNLGVGVFIWGGSHDNEVLGNRIGVNVNGQALPNLDGIEIGLSGDAGDTNNIIGGDRGASTACSDPCNIISGNNAFGVFLVTTGAVSNTVEGNNIGVDATGTHAVPNTLQGILLRGAAQNTIGGDRGASEGCTGPCNLIGGNLAEGIQITGTTTLSNAVQGNYIGLATDGLTRLPNGMGGTNAGVAVAGGAARNTIGGRHSAFACDSRCNVISGNSAEGVHISGAGTMSNTVQGNFIGLDATGSITVPNGTGAGGPYSGLALNGGTAQNTIGGAHAPGDMLCDGPCNVISGNAAQGILMGDSGTMSNTVQGNYIGLDATGSITVPNGLNGVLLHNGVSQETIGGTRP